MQIDKIEFTFYTENGITKTDFKKSGYMPFYSLIGLLFLFLQSLSVESVKSAKRKLKKL